MSLWNYARCQNASRASAAPLLEGRQPGTGSDDLAGRRSPAGVLEEGCFEEASTEAVFRLLLPNRLHWLSCLEQGRLSSPGGVGFAVHNCAQQLWFILWNVVPSIFAWLQVALEVRRKMPTLKTYRVRAALAVSLFWYSLPFPMLMEYTICLVLLWNEKLCVSHWFDVCFFPLPFGWCILKVAQYELALKETLWIWGKRHLVL